MNAARTSRSRLVAETLCVAALAAGYFAGVFRLWTGEPQRLGLGDWIDPYFINFLLEHWYRAIVSGANPLSLSIFYPSPHALGYSHTLILYAPFYATVRPFLHPFFADTASLALVLITGSTALFVVFRRALQLTLVEALVSSAFFWTSANAVNGAIGIWIQRASIFLVPTIAVVALAAIQGPPTVTRKALAGLAGFLAALLPTQDFYTGALTMLVIVLLLPGLLPASPLALARRAESGVRAEADRQRSARAWTPPSPWWAIAGGGALAIWIALGLHPIERIHVGWIRVSAHDTTIVSRLAIVFLGYFAIRRWRLIAWTTTALRAASTAWRRADGRLIAAVVGALAGIALFLVVYAGAFFERGSFPTDQLLSSLTVLTADNVHRPWTLLTSNQAYPTLRGFALVLVLAITTWTMPVDEARRWRRHAGWFLVVAVIVLLIPYRFGEASLWKTLIAPVPGLGAIRDPKRIIEPFELAMASFAAVFLSQQRKRGWTRAVVVAAMIGLTAVNWNDQTFSYRRDPLLFDRIIRAPIGVNPSCRSFFLRPESPEKMSRSDNPPSLYGVDASFFTIETGLPTLNGYSGWWPTDWRLSNAQDVNYMKDLDEWIQTQRLHDVCQLDVDARTMTPYGARR